MILQPQEAILESFILEVLQKLIFFPKYIGQKVTIWAMLINTNFTFKLVESSTPKFVFEVQKVETTKR